MLAATVARDFAPNVPIIACAILEENVRRIQQAGADYALSVSKVAGQLLVHHVLGEMISQQAHIKMIRFPVGELAGRHPLETRIRERTGCTIVAVQRKDEIILDMPASLVLDDGDELYVCGMVNSFEGFYEEFGSN